MEGEHLVNFTSGFVNTLGNLPDWMMVVVIVEGKYTINFTHIPTSKRYGRSPKTDLVLMMGLETNDAARQVLKTMFIKFLTYCKSMNKEYARPKTKKLNGISSSSSTIDSKTSKEEIIE